MRSKSAKRSAAGFLWDEINIAKVRNHGFEPADVEWVFVDGDSITIEHPTTKDRLIEIGYGRNDVLVIIPFEIVGSKVRVVTAYEAEHHKWWKVYEHEKNKRR